jgi:hypothetical protein
MSPDELAATVLRRIAKGHGLIIEPALWRWLLRLDALFPAFGEWVVGRKSCPIEK